MTRGRFITIEGGDGAGKTVQTARICAALEARGVETLATREPGGSPGAEEIRRLLVSGPADRWDPLTEAMLHATARRDHVLQTIEPALARGLWVISDRFFDSMIVYQGYGQGADLAELERLNDLSLGGLRPDLTVLLDISVVEGLWRAEPNRYERMGSHFQEKVLQGFRKRAEAEPERFAVVDAEPAPELVERAILEIVAERLPVSFDD